MYASIIVVDTKPHEDQLSKTAGRKKSEPPTKSLSVISTPLPCSLSLNGLFPTVLPSSAERRNQIALDSLLLHGL